MTKDEIMTLANQTSGQHWMDEAHIQRFAAQVEAKAAAAEREACATVCDAASEPRKGYGQTDEQWAASTLAERIRARGQQ